MPIPTVGQSAEVAPDLATLVKEKMAAAMVTDFDPRMLRSDPPGLPRRIDTTQDYAEHWRLEGPR